MLEHLTVPSDQACLNVTSLPLGAHTLPSFCPLLQQFFNIKLRKQHSREKCRGGEEKENGVRNVQRGQVNEKRHIQSKVKTQAANPDRAGL